MRHRAGRLGCDSGGAAILGAEGLERGGVRDAGRKECSERGADGHRHLLDRRRRHHAHVNALGARDPERRDARHVNIERAGRQSLNHVRAGFKCREAQIHARRFGEPFLVGHENGGCAQNRDVTHARLNILGHGWRDYGNGKQGGDGGKKDAAANGQTSEHGEAPDEKLTFAHISWFENVYFF